jgi:hypothetical protein
MQQPTLCPRKAADDMTTVIVGGDCSTTTTLALAAAWPTSSESDVVVVEADPTGGSIAAWLDTPLSPSLSTIVTQLHHSSTTGSTAPMQWNSADSMIRTSHTGIRFIPAPFRTREARSAVSEAEHSLFPLLTSAPHTIALLDVGRLDALRPPAACRDAALTILVHRLDACSAPAATVRLERLAETVAALRDDRHTVALAVIGNTPFTLHEVVEFAAPGATTWPLALDPLAAAVFAGHTGVSARRLARLPLPRSAARVSADLAATLTLGGGLEASGDLRVIEQ